MKGQHYAVIAGALLVTALVLASAVMHTWSSHYALGFADDYDKLANSLATGQGYRFGPGLAETMMREPGYPLFLAGVFALAGYGVEQARVANFLLAAAAALLLWHLARRVSGDQKVGSVAVVLFLLHPGTLAAQARGGVEILFTLGIVGFLVLLYRAIDSEKPARYFLAGMVLGLLVLVRSTPLLFPLVLAPFLVATAPRGARGRRLTHLGILLVGMGLVVSPWIVRNYALSGRLVPTATVQGVALHEGQYTCERLSLGRRFRDLQSEAGRERMRIAAELGRPVKGGYYQYFYSVADEYAFNRTLLDRTVERYRQNPRLLASCAGANLLHFWFLGKDNFATALNVVVQLPLLLLGLAGAAALARNRRASAWMLVALLIAYLYAVHLPVIAHARHSVPLIGPLAIFAASAVVAAWRRLRGRTIRQLVPT